MQSKNKKPMTTDERFHVERVKNLPCSVCDTPGPSAAHEIKQGQWFTAIALCQSCHQHPKQGWHGEKTIWKLRKMDQLDALAVTIRRLTAERCQGGTETILYSEHSEIPKEVWDALNK